MTAKPSRNRDPSGAWSYHDGTKHSPQSVRSSTHSLDWENMPRPFKVYPDLAPLPLPRELDTSPRAALELLSGTGGTDVSSDSASAGKENGISLAGLAHLLHFSAGVLRKRSFPGGESYFRAAACTGNLHHIDLYVICGDNPDLDAGVYHFGAHDHSLRRLRAGDHRPMLAHATAGEPHVATAPVVVAFATTFWRNSWKYQARAYRHAFWDSGTLLSNLLAVAAARDLPAHLVLGFIDAEVNRLLGLDAATEAALGLVTLGKGQAPIKADATQPPALSFATLPLSRRSIDYPAIRAAHEASSLVAAADVTAWRRAAAEPSARSKASAHSAAPEPDAVVDLPPSVHAPAQPIEAVILRRGSAREFSHDAIRFDQLATILRAATREIDADFVPPSARRADIYLIVNAVESLNPGTYVFARERDALVRLRAGSFRREAGVLGLGQDLSHDAAVCLFWLTDLHPVLESLGSRGYRAAQLEAAIAGGRTYLTAYALRLGATGLTFFDDEVTGFFSPHAAGKSVMFLMAVGRRPPRHEP